MQLDNTEIVIRQRSAFELLDLSVVVLRRHLWPILLTSALLGMPLMLLNVVALQWMLGEDAYLAAEQMGSPEAWLQWRHTMHLVVLFFLEFQLITLPCTVFLGNQIFFQPLPMRTLISRLRPIAWRCLWILGIVRLGLVGLVLEFLVNRDVAFDWMVELPLLMVVSALALIQRASWPFAPEILGLERCPLKPTRAGEITYSKRSRSLHGDLMSDHVARFITGSVFAGLLTAMMLSVFLFGKGVSTGDWSWDGWMDMLCLPLALWCVGLCMSVFRFLSYLDSRIRLEGWEIELRLKAEAKRLVRSDPQLPEPSVESLEQAVS